MSKLFRAATMAALMVGCNAQPKDDAAKSTATAKADDDDDNGGSPFGVPPFMAKMFTAGLEKPGPYEEPQKSANYEEGKPHFLAMELSGNVGELESMDLFSSGASVKPLRSLTAKIHKAANDANVQGMVLRVANLSIGMAHAEELRSSLIAFKGEGARKLHCHTEAAANAVYYLMTACDRIGLAPLGEVAIPGPATTPIHVKGLLDKIGVEADYIHVGDFKGAAEPLTRTEPSPEMMKTLDAIVARSYDTMVEAIVKSRGIDAQAAQQAVDQALFVAPQAVEAKLADEVATYEDFLAKATEGSAWTKPKKSNSSFSDFSAIQRFLGMSSPDRPSEPHVALVYAVGNVIDGKGNGTVGARQEIASRTLVATLRAVARDDKVKAVVLRVNSPGGSALASEQIWAAMEQLKAQKPVVVSMGGVAASGGYYISTGANTIFANQNTLTGSIGVVGGKMVVGKAMKEIGINSYEVHRGKRAMMWSSMDPWTEDERELVRQTMENIYEQFLAHVVAGRDMERDAVHEIAQGRVWTGTDAKARGLIDTIGGLDMALAHARKLGGVSDDIELEVYPGEPTLRDILTSFGAGQVVGIQQQLKDALTQIASLAGPTHAQTVAGVLKTALDLRQAKIWAVSWVQPLR